MEKTEVAITSGVEGVSTYGCKGQRSSACNIVLMG